MTPRLPERERPVIAREPLLELQSETAVFHLGGRDPQQAQILVASLLVVPREPLAQRATSFQRPSRAAARVKTWCARRYHGPAAPQSP